MSHIAGAITFNSGTVSGDTASVCEASGIDGYAGIMTNVSLREALASGREAGAAHIMPL